jgi:hypothetical protein
MKIKRRRVFYVGGYDPRGTRFYHPLYRNEAEKQAKISGYRINVSQCVRIAPGLNRWQVEWRNVEETVQTDYEFLSWDSIVRETWNYSMLQILRRSFEMYRFCFSKGIFAKITGMSLDSLFPCLSPLVFWAMAGLALLACALVAGLLVYPLAGVGLAVFAAAVIVAGGYLGARYLAGVLGVPWLLRTILFIFDWGLGGIRPEMAKRLQLFARYIRKRQEEDPVDETLIVGHSVGSILAVAVVSRLMRAKMADIQGMKLLTLGGCIPYLSLLPKGWGIRRALTTIGQNAAIPWYDATIRIDPLSFFMVDPLRTVKGGKKLPNHPKMRRVPLFLMFTKRTYAKLRFNFLRIHFQYLRAAEVPGPYDYFFITAGPRELTEEILGWPPKKPPCTTPVKK